MPTRLSVRLTPPPSLTPQPLTDRYRNAPGVYYKVFWMRHEIEPEIDYNEKTLEEYGNIGQYVITIQRKYFYSQYKVKVQVSWPPRRVSPVRPCATEPRTSCLLCFW